MDEGKDKGNGDERGRGIEWNLELVAGNLGKCSI